jgi:hypothetical protein
MNVQHWLDELPPDRSLTGGSNFPVLCPACSSIHFVNGAAGKLRVDRRDQGRRGSALYLIRHVFDVGQKINQSAMLVVDRDIDRLQ